MRKGGCSLLALASLHLCLPCKEPYWLIRMSRLIILEPFPRRNEPGCMFWRLMLRSDTCGFMPAWAFAYRKEFNLLNLVVWIRWMLALLTVRHGVLFVADLDESNTLQR